MLPPGDGVPAGLLKQWNENKQLFFLLHVEHWHPWENKLEGEGSLGEICS